MVRKTKDAPAPAYATPPRALTAAEQRAVDKALGLVQAQLGQPGAVLTSSALVKTWVSLHIGARRHEVFCCLYADAQYRLLGWQEVFRGTLTETSVYPREIAKEALRLNAAAVILAHNHPSGVLEPSRADYEITHVLEKALGLVDVKVLDHVIVAGSGAYSFMEHGWRKAT